MLDGALRGALCAETPYFAQLDCKQILRQRLAVVLALLLRVAKAERDDVLVAHQRPESFEIRQHRRAASGREREIHRRSLAARQGLRLIEIRVAVDEQQAVAAATPQRKHAAEHDRTIAAEQDGKLAALDHVRHRVREPHGIFCDAGRIAHEGLRITLGVVGRGWNDAAGAPRMQLVRQAMLKQHSRQSLDARRLQAEDRRRFDNRVTVHCAANTCNAAYCSSMIVLPSRISPEAMRPSASSNDSSITSMSSSSTPPPVLTRCTREYSATKKCRISVTDPGDM